MFDPRDIADDPRTRTPAKPKPTLDRGRERADRRRRRIPRRVRSAGTDRPDFTEPGCDRARCGDRHLPERGLQGHERGPLRFTPLCHTRRAVDRMIQRGDVREMAAKGPRGGTYKVLTLTRTGRRSGPRA